MIDAGAYAELFDNSAMERRKRATRRGARFGYFRAGGVLQSRSANPPYLVDGQRDHLESGSTASPSGESRTGGPRSNNAPPNFRSSWRIAIESDG